ncbi:MAG: nucleotidyltransferase domain-containing protein [Patescibacteria group bacterium]
MKNIIKRHINLRDYKIFIFGSRAKGRARKFSDYDVGIIGKKEVPSEKMILIEEEFENSDLPYSVEVIDFAMVSDDFKKIALKKIKKL